MKNIYFLFLFTLLSSELKASHLAAGTIYYEYLSPLTYKINLVLYRDCKVNSLGNPVNVALGGTNVVTATSVSCGQSISITVDTTGNNTKKMVPDMCASIVNWCIDYLSTFPGYEEWHYSAVVTLPMQCDDWVFGFDNCCRNGAINNLNIPGLTEYYISAKLNNLTSLGNFNNSAQYIVGTGFNYLVNQDYTINQTAIDTDGDSLVFSLTSALRQNGLPCYYNPIGGYSATTPLGTPTATNYANIDPLTGNFSFRSALQSVNVIAINIDEYRNGILVGSTIRDLQFNFINGPANSLPTLSGVNGTTNYYTSINVCSGSTLNFTVNGSDVDVADSVLITTLIPLMGSSTFTTNNALQQTGTFSWTPTLADIRPNPYLLVLQAEDNNCHSVSYGYLIYVNQCTTDSVWAGDANDDFTANNYDVLNIGIANGTLGVVRPAATTNWVAEYCPNWTNYFINGVNYKHADCNGDGIVDANDVNAVTLNYGMIHFKKSNPGLYKQRGFPDLYFDVTGLTANAGDTLHVPVMLGTNSSPVDSIYGISGQIHLNNNLSAPLSLNNATSWIGNSISTFLFQQTIGTNEISFTLVRNNQQHVNGYGQIATLNIPISSLAINGSQLNMNFSDLKLIDKFGNEIADYNVINDSMNVYSTTPVTNHTIEKLFMIYPNPVKDEMCIEFQNTTIGKPCYVEMCNLMGNVLVIKDIPMMLDTKCILNTRALMSGMYFIRIRIDDQVLIKKFIK